MKTITTSGWEGYELLQSGNRQRLERVGDFCIVRPDPNAIWPLSQPVDPRWKQADAVFGQNGDSRNPWQFRGNVPEDWFLTWNDCRFRVHLTPFRHIGVFPEQAAQWQWLDEIVQPQQRVLNLFAYSGAATVVAARKGAAVTHVDASKPAVEWAADNARINQVEVRWMVEDVRKFVKREVRRGNKYDVILLDPPVFGRGTKGEVWRLEENLPELLTDLRQLSTPDTKIWLNFYAAAAYPLTVQRLAEQALGRSLELGALSLCESVSENLLQTGFLLRS